MTREFNKRPHRYVHGTQLVCAAEIRQIDDEHGGFHDGTEIAQELTGRRCSPAGCDQVIDQNDPLA